MTIRTSGGHIVETLAAHGKFTPYLDEDNYYVLLIAVDGVLCPEIQVEKPRWEYEKATRTEPQFWHDVAEDALNMAQSLRLLQNRA